MIAVLSFNLLVSRSLFTLRTKNLELTTSLGDAWRDWLDPRTRAQLEVASLSR
jgi:hypothetical protein